MAQTINVANIKIDLQLSGTDFARNEINLITKVLRETETPLDKFHAQMLTFDKALKAGAISAGQFAQAEEHLAKKFGVLTYKMEEQIQAEKKLAESKLKTKESEEARQAKFQTYLDGIRRQSEATDAFGSSAPVAIKKTTFALSDLAVAGASLSLVKGLADFGKGALGLAMEVEQVRAQIDVFTKSEEATKKLMAEFIRLDQASALSNVSFQNASKTLMQFGVGVRDVVPIMEAMSEISMGNEQRFQSLALAFGQAQAAGRLMGQEVLQMVNAGFNPLQQISKDTGISVAQLRKDMEEGKISVEMLSQAFINATKDGGAFAGMNEKMAQTTSVKIAKLQSEFKQFVTAVGEREIKPGVDLALDGMIRLVEMSKAKKELTAEELAVVAETERIEKRRADQERERAQLAKQIADQREREAQAQQKAIEADNRRIDSERSAFQNRIKQIAEERTKAGMSPEQYEKAKLFDDTFGMTAGERQQAEAALMDLSETRRLNELNAVHSQIEAANKQLEIEKQVAAMKEKNFLSSDALRKEYATLDEIFKRQLQEAGDNEKQKEGIRKRAAMAEQSIFARSEFEAMQQKKQGAQDRFAPMMQSIAANIAPAMKAGTKEVAAFLTKQNADVQQKIEQKKWQEAMLKEQQKANELAVARPSIALAR